MKYLLLACFLFCCLASTYAEQPIEVIYWKPLDVEAPSQAELDRLNGVMSEIQSFFASEMDRHGFGEKTFDFKDIAVVEGDSRLEAYRRNITSHSKIQRESGFMADGLDNQIYVVFLGGAGHLVSGALGLSQQLCADIQEQLIYCNNLVVVSAEIHEALLPVVAHEIGHAFSLGHPQQRLIGSRVDVMYVPLVIAPGVVMTLKQFALSKADAVFLNDGGRLSVQEAFLDTDVNGDGYTDLYDCLIVRSAMSAETIYDTDVNNDGVTNILDLMLVKTVAFEAIAAASPRKLKGNFVTTWGALKRK